MRISLLIMFMSASVIANCQSIQLSVSSPTVTVVLGQTQQFVVDVTPSGGFNQQLFFSGTCYTGNCNNLFMTFAPNPAIYPYSGGVTATVTANSSAHIGPHDFYVIATNGPVTDTINIIVDVLPSSNCTFTLGSLFLEDYYTLAAGPAGVWIAGNRLTKYSGGVTTDYGIPLSGKTWDVALDSQGNLWLASFNGVGRFDGTFWSAFNTSNSNLETNNFGSITVDNAGNVWAVPRFMGQGLPGSGIYKYDSVWTKYDSTNSTLPTSLFSEISVDRNGHVWVFGYSYATSSMEIFIFDGANWTKVNYPTSCLPISHPSKIAFDSQNNAWFGIDLGMSSASLHAGLVKFDGSTIEKWCGSSLIPDNHFVYDTTCHQLIHDQVPAMTAPDVFKVMVDVNDVVWFSASEMGLGRLDVNGFTIFNTSNSNISRNMVWGMDESNDTIYLVNATHRGGGSFDFEYFTCDLTSGIPINNYQEKLSVFPNPATGYIHFDLEMKAGKTGRLRIFNMNGQMVQELKVKEGRNTLDLQGYSNGLYAFIYEVNGDLLTGKFVIDK